MTRCVECDTELPADEAPYRCGYCREPVCSDHRLPENHTCPRMFAIKRPSEASEGNHALPSHNYADSRHAAAQDPSRRTQSKGQDRRLPGRSKSAGSKSPDVNPDGSIAGEATNTSSLLEKLLFWR